MISDVIKKGDLIVYMFYGLDWKEERSGVVEFVTGFDHAYDEDYLVRRTDLDGFLISSVDHCQVVRVFPLI